MAVAATAARTLMLDRALEVVASRLNQHLRHRLQSDEDLVLVTNVVAADGTPAPAVEDKLGLFVVNVEKDGLPQTRRSGLGGGRLPRTVEPLHLNVHLMVAAGYSEGNYPQALKLIGEALRFFQAQPVFDRRSAPELDGGLERLVLDLENLSTQDLSHLWGVLGGRYLPSALYLMRTVVIAPDAVTGQVDPVRVLDAVATS